MKYDIKNRRRKQGGQVMSEYALTLVVFTMVALASAFLIGALMDHGWRVISLVAWEPYN